MKHCHTLARYFNEAGVDARAITSKTSREERTKMLEEFEKNKYPVLINIGLFTEGLSIDDTETIAFAVATRSPTKYFQAATRGSRPVFNSAGENIKDHCLILDFGGNTERHGFVDDYDIVPFTLEGTPPRSKEAHMKVCPKCEEVVFVQTKKCPGCGYKFPVKVKIDEKLYVDEVEFREIQRAKSLYKKIVELDYGKIEQALIQNPRPEIIRAIGMIKGYNQFWAVHAAYRMGYLGWMGRKPVSLKDKHRAIKWLKEQEKEKGYDGVVEQLKSRLL
jgi:superfamily II DNA or RNA helicase